MVSLLANKIVLRTSWLVHTTSNQNYYKILKSDWLSPARFEH